MAKEPVTKWKLPSVDGFRQRIAEKNDGSMPREPWQRLSQVKFEKWLKGRYEKDEMIDARFGWKIEHVEMIEGKVRTKATELKREIVRCLFLSMQWSAILLPVR